MITKELKSWMNHLKNLKWMKKRERITVRIENNWRKEDETPVELKNARKYSREFDTRERRDHELTKEYWSDAPVRFGERELKADMNNSEIMGSGESNWKNSWIALDGWKEFSQSKTIMRGWHQARTMNLQENGPRFKRNSSSFFECWDWWRETPPWIF